MPHLINLPRIENLRRTIRPQRQDDRAQAVNHVDRAAFPALPLPYNETLNGK